jgi:succinate-semialdehyde dehydrogenase
MDQVPVATSGVRAASSFIHDKAFVNGKWVSAKSGATFAGME